MGKSSFNNSKITKFNFQIAWYNTFLVFKINLGDEISVLYVVLKSNLSKINVI